ncbi:hypothetical protein BD779DRAFT_1677058 [Infundibulicybe gibba]|nr:hypothetical protein BD779DRAFT_1677058 [Infundibulicybe gibba]
MPPSSHPTALAPPTLGAPLLLAVPLAASPLWWVSLRLPNALMHFTHHQGSRIIYLNHSSNTQFPSTTTEHAFQLPQPPHQHFPAPTCLNIQHNAPSYVTGAVAARISLPNVRHVIASRRDSATQIECLVVVNPSAFGHQV